MNKNRIEELKNAWMKKWPEALEAWSKYTKLKEPVWCLTKDWEIKEGLSGSFAMIRLNDQAVVVSLRQIIDLGLQDFPLEIMAHEIGHHVYCPADLSDQARLIARIRKAMPGKEHLASMVSNLYADLMINNRLQRNAGFNMGEVYRRIGKGAKGRLWKLYMRIYEILWSMPSKHLIEGDTDGILEGDAQLGARVIRKYSLNWLAGAGRFACLCFPYILEDNGLEIQEILKNFHDIHGSPVDGVPAGLTGMDEDEEGGNIHPSLDDDLSGSVADIEGKEVESTLGPHQKKENGSLKRGQFREPFEYGQILKNLGLNLSDHEIAVNYYKERAIPHLIPFPVREVPRSVEPLIEGVDPWDMGMPLHQIDWFESLNVSPNIIPGVTTVQRSYGWSEGEEPQKEPVDLDLYIDSSGSMPNPQRQMSYLTLAGAIIALSALRVGSRVQATLWSGTRKFQTTSTFITDQKQILQTLTGYLGGSTAFPIHVLRETYVTKKANKRRVHILVISDDGVTTMFDQDELGNSGKVIAEKALQEAAGGGTLALNLQKDYSQDPKLILAKKIGWDICPIKSWEDLLLFAAFFSKRHYVESKR